MGRIPKKTAYWTAKKEMEGRLQAVKEYEAKKSIYEKLKPYLQKIAEKIDPLEIIAISGMTIIIKTGIDWSEDLLESEQGRNLIKTFARMGSMGLSDWILLGIPNPTDEQAKEFGKLFDTPTAELIEWVLSFTAAVIIYKYFDSLDDVSVLGVAQKIIGVIP